MKAIAIAVCAALVATYAFAQGGAMPMAGRYLLQPAADKPHSAWVVDTTTGKVAYCYATVSTGGGPVNGVLCVK